MYNFNTDACVYTMDTGEAVACDSQLYTPFDSCVCTECEMNLNYGSMAITVCNMHQIGMPADMMS